MKKYYCIKCKVNEIHKHTFIYGSGLCQHCSSIKRFKDPKEKEKLRQANLGKKLTEEHKAKIRKASKKRFQDPKEREKIAKVLKDIKRKPFTKETKLKMSNSHKGKKVSLKTRKKISEAMKGRKLTKEQKQNLSKAIKGKNHWNYIDGKSKLPYSPEFTPSLRNEIKTRDSFKCQCCGMTQAEHFDKYNRDIEIHHIDYNKFNCKPENLITLCHKCNVNANANRDYWFAYYTYKIENSILLTV